MKNTYIMLILLLFIPLGASAQSTAALDQLIKTYSHAAQGQPSAQKGKEIWFKKHSHQGEFSQRSCTTCHTDSLLNEGKHIKTGKRIKPMSAAVNSKRFTKVRKIKKWIKRNCKWTIGRECSNQEKVSILLYLSH